VSIVVGRKSIVIWFIIPISCQYCPYQMNRILSAHIINKFLVSFRWFFRLICGGAVLAIGGVVVAAGQTAPSPSTVVGDGTLVPAPGGPYIMGAQPSIVASGDFNGDGLPDLVVATSQETSTITILLASRGGTFVPAPNPISVGWYNTSIAVADFNGDGNVDIASIGGSIGPTGLQVFLGDGQGGFSLMPPILRSSVGFNDLQAIGVGDFNHDGNTDLVIAGANNIGSSTTGYVAILLGDGTGHFTSAPGSPTQTIEALGFLTVADFNLDGNLDVATTSPPLNQVAILLGDGRGGLYPGPGGPFPTGETPQEIVHGDFNGDGKIDLAVANLFAATLTILLGDGAGGFTPQPDISIGPVWTPAGLAVGDVDGDGKLDLAVAVANQSNFTIFLGDGKGGFDIASFGFFNVPGQPVGVTLADFNGDGRLDVATANAPGTVSVFLGALALSALQFNGSSPMNPTVGANWILYALSPPMGFDRATGTVSLQDGSAVVATAPFDSYGNATFAVTFTTAGAHTLVATYPGDLRTTGSTTPPLAIDVGKGTQTISFPILPNPAYGDPPFTVPAFASSGLPVALTVVSGPATISGNVLTLTGVGAVTLQASQPGNANWLPAPDVQQQFQVAAPSLRIDAVLNAASYGAGSLAPSSFAVVFGANLAALASAVNPGTTLGGTGIQITDASGKTSNAMLYFASPAQVNLMLPANLSLGMGTMTVQTQTGISAATPISIAAVSPGLFSADASGTGVAAGNALLVSADGTQTQLPISSCSGTPPVCTAIPIDLGTSSDSVYLSLFGTGIRGRSALAEVTATIGGIAANVIYAGAQPDYPGLDQVNLQINPALRGRASVPIALTVNGAAANVVTVAIQ
jgi:uncharacterized protein (TIGR03437 family)